MTGPEHYRKAEDALSHLDEERDPDHWRRAVLDGSLAVSVAAAQVHATLALAAATALQYALASNPNGDDGQAWDSAASEYAKRGPS